MQLQNGLHHPPGQGQVMGQDLVLCSCAQCTGGVGLHRNIESTLTDTAGHGALKSFLGRISLPCGPCLCRVCPDGGVTVPSTVVSTWTSWTWAWSWVCATATSNHRGARAVNDDRIQHAPGIVLQCRPRSSCRAGRLSRLPRGRALCTGCWRFLRITIPTRMRKPR